MILTDIIVFNMSMWIIVASFEGLNFTNEETDLQLSGVKDAWTNTPPYCHLAGFDYFSPEMLSKLRDILPVAENVWIHARAKQTPYFIFRSCLNHFNNLQDLQTKQFRDNSVFKCLEHCQEINITIFGLTADNCTCIKSPAGLASEYKEHCCLGCPGNLNDCCGNYETIMAVYDFVTVRDWVEPEVEIDRRCAVVNSTFNQTFVRKCTNAYGVKCSRWNVTQTKVSWSGAMDYCRTRHRNIDTIATHYQNLSSPEYVWTPLQRSSQLHWGSTIHAFEFPWCVSIRKDKDQRLSLHEEYCETKHRHCVVCDQQRDEHSRDIPTCSTTKVMMYALIATSTIAITLLTGFAISTFTKRKCKTRPATNAVQNDIFEANNPSRNLTDMPVPCTANVNRIIIHDTLDEVGGVSDTCAYSDEVSVDAETNELTTHDNRQQNNEGAITGAV